VASALARRARKDRSGSRQRRASASGRARRPDLTSYYGRKLPPITPGEFEFRLDLYRGKRHVMVLDTVESFEWNDDNAALSGNVQLRRPDPEDAESLPIGRAMRIRCRTRWAGRLYELWTMRCDPPEVTLDEGGVIVSVDVKDDMALVASGSRRYVYRKTKRRRHGWFGHDALRDAARKDGIRLGAIVKCRKRMSKIDVTGSFLDLATKVYENEQSVTGWKYILRMRDGKFEAVRYVRNRTLYVLGEELRSGVVTQAPKVEKPVTVWTGKARLGKGKGAKHVRYTEARRSMIERFGRTTKVQDYGRVDSMSELKRKVKRDLAKQYEVAVSIDVQCQGVPFIRRGDGAQVLVPSENFRGWRSFVYCSGAHHQVQGESYTSQFTFDRDDPFEADRVRREKEAKDRARKRKKRKAKAAA
jgi:ribosomal protein L16/L10AE